MPESVQIPDTLDTPEFRELWAEWVEAHGGKRYSARAQRMALRKMTPWGAEAACAALIHSMAGGYQGVFQDPHFRPQSGPQKTATRPLSTWEVKEKLRAIENRLDESDLLYESPDPAKEKTRIAERRRLFEERKKLKTQLLQT